MDSLINHCHRDLFIFDSPTTYAVLTSKFIIIIMCYVMTQCDAIRVGTDKCIHEEAS